MTWLPISNIYHIWLTHSKYLLLIFGALLSVCSVVIGSVHFCRTKIYRTFCKQFFCSRKVSNCEVKPNHGLDDLSTIEIETGSRWDQDQIERI